MIDNLIEMTCMYACDLLCFYHVKFYVPDYYHVNYCKAARALVKRQRYALRQMFNHYVHAIDLI